MTRYLGVDLGEKNIGVALSDPMGMIAEPYRGLRHENRAEDARRLADIARAESASVIIVGQALGPNGEETPSARHAAKVAQAIRDVFSEGDVRLWDESGSTRAVKRLYIEMGVPRKDRRGHLDDRAAAYILQDYLDWQAPPQFSTDNRDEGNENGSDG